MSNIEHDHELDKEAELSAILSLLQYASLSLDELNLDNAKLPAALSHAIRETRAAIHGVRLRDVSTNIPIRRVQ